MKKLFLTLSVLLISGSVFAQGGSQEQVVTFKFLAGQDMFYIPWGGNDTELNRLYSLVDEYRAEITAGRMPVYVDGYCASLPTEAENRHTAFVRANRVKSELITNKGLSEEHFITRNHAAATEQAERERLAALQAAPSKPYCFAVRTNLLYDAFLLPTLGVEWRVSQRVGIKLDGSYSHWGDEHGKVQKIWLVNPELRWYLLAGKRFYVGASANFGEYNVYKHMLGGLFSGDIGYQGKLWGTGLTVGYQLHLSRSFSLDFNLGLGYTSLEYDSFNMIDATRVYKGKGKSKDFWGLTQAGISLIWTIGGNK